MIVPYGYYVPIVPHTLNQVKVYIRGSDESVVAFTYKVACVLHLKKLHDGLSSARE